MPHPWEHQTIPSWYTTQLQETTLFVASQTLARDRLCDGADITTLKASGFYNLYSVNGSPLSPFWASNEVSKTGRKQTKTPLLGQQLFKVE